ncbi:tandem-95 repeat protein [Brevibacillus fluminis]|uniref:tandem-95 repeat protein n=1 Tax=Brevibacillus fluminis TaxID=511487 RepID=UPI001C83908D|nr:tandem-95 repeat protein [Brevibacillus fluminis]
MGQKAQAASAAPTWLSPSSTTSNMLQGVRYGAGEWLALGVSDTIASSGDGKHWTLYHTGGFNEWADAVYDGGNWILVGSGKIYQSPAGTAASDTGWTALKTDFDNYLWGIAYGGGKYVAVGDKGTILTSSNKFSWSTQQLSGEIGNFFTAVVYANGKFVTVSSSGCIYTSTDGQSWSKAYSGSSTINSVTFGNGKFVAVGDGKAYTSMDGNAWSSTTTNSSMLYSVDYGNNKFAAVGAGGTLITSADGVSWAPTEQSNTAQDLYAVRYAPEQSRFVVVGDGGVIRTQSSMSDLSNLTLSAGTLTPAFAQATKTYTASVDTAVDQITVTLTPADSDATITVNGNNAAVTGGTASSNVPLNPGANNIQIRVTSQDGSKQTDYTLTVTRAIPNAPPTDIGLDKTSLPENAGVGTLIGTLSATDADSTVFTYSLVSGFGDNASFTIAGNQLKSNAVFDYETKNSYSIQIRVTDSGGASYDKIFTIQVTNVAEAPTVSNSSKSGSEDNPLSIGAADFTAAYADPENDSLKKVQVTSLPNASAGVLKLNGTAVAANQEIDAADLGQLVFEPVANWNGTATFTWKGNDGTFYSANAATFTLTIVAVNDLPTVTDSTKNGTEDTAVAFDVTDFAPQFADVDGNALAGIKIVSLPDVEAGTLMLNGSAVSANQDIAANALDKLQFVPVANWFGTASFTWKGFDGTDYSQAAATLKLEIGAVNDPPTVSNSAKNGTEDTELPFTKDDFEQQYLDVEKEALASIQIVSLPAHGTLNLNGVVVSANQSIAANQLGQLAFVPDADWNGSTGFTWKGYDGQAYSAAAATFTLTIGAVEDLPTVTNGIVNGVEDQPLALSHSVLAPHFADADGDSLQAIQVISLPDHGTLQLNGTDVAVDQVLADSDLVNLYFVPDKDWNGETSFTWKANDGKGESATAAKLTIVLSPANDLPTVTNSSKTGDEDTNVTFALTDFSGHFSDIDQDSLSKIQIVTLPSNGRLQLGATPVTAGQEIAAADLDTLVFVPDANWSGSTIFTWKGHDGTGYSLNEAVLKLTISDVNDAPTVTDSSKNGTEDTALALGSSDFTLQYHDVENEPLAKVQIVSLPVHGALKVDGHAINANDELTVADLDKLSFVPDADWNGSTSFTWKGYDGNSYSALATFTFVFAPVEDMPTVKNSSVAGQEDHVLAFAATDFSDNFTDVDGDGLSQVKIESLPAYGVLNLNGNPVSAGQVIAAIDLGALGYTPQANWNGADSFTWKASDGKGYSTDAATMDLTIAPENDPPAVSDVTMNGNEDEEMAFAPNDFTAHFTDDDGDHLSKIQIVTLPAHGTLTLDGVAVSENQDIAAAEISKLHFVPGAEWSGSTSFAWKAHDGNDYSVSTANVFVNIAAVNDPPTMDDSSKHGVEDTAVAFAQADFTGVYHDAENDSLQKVKIVSLPNHGTLMLNHAPVTVDQQIDVNELDELTFAPDADWNGTTGFTWKGYDGADYATKAAEMSIEIATVNDLPTVSDSSKNGSEGNVMTFAANDFTTHFKDVDGDALQKVQIDSLPTGGTLKLDGTAVSVHDEIDATDLRKLTFTPRTSGTTSFTWKGSDDSGYSNDAATLTLKIAPVIVIPPGSNDADLRGLSISGGTLKPDFHADQTSYSVEVDSDVNRIIVTPIASHWAAAITVNGKSVASGTSATIAIKDGGADVQIVVTAQDGTTKTYSISISQGDAPITDIQLDKRSISLKEGDRPVQLNVSVEPAHASTKGLVWTSSKQEVATVDDTGTIVPLSVGTTTITVSTPDGKISATSRVTVKAGKIQELLAEPQMLVLGEGESESVAIKAFYGYETVKEIKDGIVWSSDDEEIATVTDGEIKAEAEGNTIVTASYKGKKVNILVKVIPVKFVDEAAVKAAFTPPAKGSTRYRLTAAGTLLTKESVTVQVKLGTKTYSATIGKDRSFSLDRAMTWKGEIPDQIDVVIKSRKAGGKTQIVTIPLKTFDPESIEVTEKRKGEYTISGDLLDPSLVAKVEAVTKDGEQFAGKVDDQQFVISLKNIKEQTVTVRVVLYSGFEQEAEVELP